MLTHQYSNNICKKRVAVCGPTPPPLGGVAVHIKRVAEKLRTQQNTVVHFNTTQEYRYRFLVLYLCRIAWWLVRQRPDIVQYHTTYVANSMRELQLLCMLKKLFGYKLVLIEHDCRHGYTRTKWWVSRYRIVLNTVDQLVLIGDSTQKQYNELDLLSVPYTVESSFLPPDVTQQKTLFSYYPQTFKQFIAAHSPCIAVNAFQLTLLGGKDLYGIDQAVTLLAELAPTHNNVGLVILLAQIGNQQYFKIVQQQIQQRGLQNRVYILHGNHQLWPLFAHVDLFIRPTLSDSFGISVQEALYCGTPVIASDACARATGTYIYKTGDVGDLIRVSTRHLRSANAKELLGKSMNVPR